ncbi:hypothetical protein D3C81_1428290 [compost metagenome]
MNMQVATLNNPKIIALGMTLAELRKSGANGVTNSQPTNMNIAMPTSDRIVIRSVPTNDTPNQPSSCTAGAAIKPSTPNTINVVHMPKVRMISALPKALTPKALRMANTTTNPTPSNQEPPADSASVLRCSKFTSAMTPDRMVSAVPANTCTIRYADNVPVIAKNRPRPQLM